MVSQKWPQFTDFEANQSVERFVRDQIRFGILQLLNHHSSDARAECAEFVGTFMVSNLAAVLPIIEPITDRLRELLRTDDSQKVRISAARALDEIVQGLIRGGEPDAECTEP